VRVQQNTIFLKYHGQTIIPTKSERTPSISGTIHRLRLSPSPLPPAEHHQAIHLSLGNTIVPLDALDPVRVAGPGVQVHTRVVIVIGPAAQQIASADAAVARLAAVEEPRAGGEVDRVAGVVHCDVDVVVAFVFVGGGALGAGRGVLVCGAGWGVELEKD
jgi:hypothetical protein